MTALSDLLAEHQPRSYYRCRCSWQGDRFDVHLHDVLAAAANRTAVVAGLVEAGVIEHAGCWDAPEVTDEQIAEAEKEVDRLVKRIRAEGEEGPFIALERAVRHLNKVSEHRDRITVYYEDEDRPAGAVPLYRIGAPS